MAIELEEERTSAVYQPEEEVARDSREARENVLGSASAADWPISRLGKSSAERRLMSGRAYWGSKA